MMLTDESDPRLSCSWRYAPPLKAKSQDFYDAFELKDDEPSLSFFVNSNIDMNTEDKRSEIFHVYESINYKLKKSGRCLEVDLINAQEEANFPSKQISAIIDRYPHCSLFYLGGCYEDEDDKAEIINILYNNIKDVVSISKNQNQIVILDCND